MFNHVAAVVATLKARKLAKEKEDAEASATAAPNSADKAVADQPEEKRRRPSRVAALRCYGGLLRSPCCS